MLSLKETSLLSRLLGLSCTSLAFPLDWDPRTRKLYEARSRWKLPATAVLTVTNFLYVIFILVRFYLDWKGITDPEGRNANYRIFHILFALIHIILCGVHGGAILNRQELVDFVNQLLQFNSEAGNQYFGRESMKPEVTKRRELIANMFLACLSSSAFFLIIAYPVTWKKPYYVYSVLPAELRNNYLFGVTWFIEAGFILYTLLLMSVVSILGYVYYISTNFWLHKICIEWPLGINPLRHSFRHLQLYNSLRLLNNLYNLVLSPIWIPTLKGTCTLFALLDIYGMVRLVNVLPLFIYLYLPVIYSFFAILFITASSLMAEVYHASCLQPKSWVRHTLKLSIRNPILYRWNKRVSRNGKKYFHMYLKSCRPLRCEVGPYFVERMTKITLLGILINGGISCLLMFE